MILTITFVAFIVIAGVPTWAITDIDHPFTDINECWEVVDRGIENGDIKLGEGVTAECMPYLEDGK